MDETRPAAEAADSQPQTPAEPPAAEVTTPAAVASEPARPESAAATSAPTARGRRVAARHSPFAALDAHEQARLRRFLLRWTRPGCGLAVMFGLTLAVWAWAAVYPHPVLWLLGALLTPWVTPVVGGALGLVLGLPPVLRRAAGLTLGLGLAAWAVGYAVGRWASPAATPWAARAWVGPDMTTFVVTLVAAAWGTVLLARRRAAALLPGAALTWALALPLFWAGVFVAQGDLPAAQDALVAFATHWFWSWVLAGVTLVFLGLYPASWTGYGLLVLFFVLGLGSFLFYAEADLQRRLPPAVTPLPSPGVTEAPPAPPTPTAAPAPSATPTPTPSPLPSPTSTAAGAVATYTVVWPTATPSPTATPMYAVVRASARYTGIYVREGPGFDYPAFTGLLNGTQVIVLPEQAEADGLQWVKVRFEEFGRVKEGWVLYHLLLFVTPTPTPLD